MDRKDTQGKIDPFLIPWEALVAYNAVSDYGQVKYEDRDSWKNSSPKEGVFKYLKAMTRHAWKMVRGEEIDPESGLPHAYACLWNACAVVWHWERLADGRCPTNSTK